MPGIPGHLKSDTSKLGLTYDINIILKMSLHPYTTPDTISKILSWTLKVALTKLFRSSQELHKNCKISVIYHPYTSAYTIFIPTFACWILKFARLNMVRRPDTISYLPLRLGLRVTGVISPRSFMLAMRSAISSSWRTLKG